MTDKIAPVTVAASHTLSDGTPYNFKAKANRQRAALLLSSGNIYAGFASFCDFTGSQSRGWLLGWQASNLAPLVANTLTDTLATAPDSYFLSSIWMSGYGIAAANGNLFFSTGNSAPGTYDGVQNIQESVVKLDPQLVKVRDIFTPSNVNDLDASDNDVSSGGVLVVPLQPGPVPGLAVATSKFGRMFLLNRASLGGFTPGGPDNVLDEKTIGVYCWCGPSYFTGPDGVGRVVSSGGSGDPTTYSTRIIVWKVQTSPKVEFVKEGKASPLVGNSIGLQEPGSFTTVSSNGTQAGTAIIWTVARPTDPHTFAVTLYAFAATPSGGTLPVLFSSPAGSWPNIGWDANIVPVVANGRVFVASNRQLTIFGLGGHPFVASAAEAKPAALNTHEYPNAITGVLEQANGPVLTLRTRTGTIARVDDSEALRKEQIGVLVPGRAYTAQGTYDSTGALRAQAVGRATPSPASWPRDR